MKKHVIPVIVSVVLIAAGAVICGFSLSAMHFDMNRLSTAEYKENSFPVTDAFRDIRIRTGMEKICFAASEDGKCRVDILDHEKVDHSVRTEDDTLVIETTDARNWTDFVGVFTRSPQIMVFLPESRYESLLIENSTGDAALSSLDFDGSITYNTSTGDLHMRDVTCADLNSDGNTGEVFLERVLISGACRITRNTGDVEFDDSDAASISIETSTGDVSGTLLSDKSFTALSVTGDVEVPLSGTGGSCEITTTTGDIEIAVRGN
ncbi:MAG: DUF4097 domain-containing protein [Lachnospiraceae bacterium]|nr:DUF4097 domain-containing protein [Lachnospiraceae bacterium]